MNLKAWELISSTLMGLGGFGLGGYLVTHNEVAIGSALIGAVSSAWFLHRSSSSTIAGLSASQADTVTQLLSKISGSSPTKSSSL